MQTKRCLEPVDPDDRILPATRALSVFIVPFLVVAFVVLFFGPTADDTARLFAWRIKPPFTPMVLGSIYLGGAYFFVRAASAREWHRIRGGFISIGTFATLMGVATILHWDRFLHHNVAFWLWAALYFTTPFLVFGVFAANERATRTKRADELLIPRPIAAGFCVAGAAAAGSAAYLFSSPSSAISAWPWALTPLTARAMAAIFALGVAGVAALGDRRWSSARLLVQVEGLMLALVAVSVLRAHDEFDTSRTLTWAFAAGFACFAVASVVFYVVMERRDRRPIA